MRVAATATASAASRTGTSDHCKMSRGGQRDVVVFAFSANGLHLATQLGVLQKMIKYKTPQINFLLLTPNTKKVK